MQKTSYNCDLCRQDFPKEKMTEMRVEDRMHDVCTGCSGKISKVLRGTGRPISQPALTGQLSNLTPANIPPNWAELWKDQQDINAGGLIPNGIGQPAYIGYYTPSQTEFSKEVTSYLTSTSGVADTNPSGISGINIQSSLSKMANSEAMTISANMLAQWSDAIKSTDAWK